MKKVQVSVQQMMLEEKERTLLLNLTWQLILNLPVKRAGVPELEMITVGDINSNRDLLSEFAKQHWLLTKINEHLSSLISAHTDHKSQLVEGPND